ncbi:MAG TPA: hypothetical protein VKE92_11265 [Anaerolineales bacterium]|nr:hypothetical protein [Anaerolineales bacterium]
MIGSFRSYHTQIESPLPQDRSGFLGNRHKHRVLYWTSTPQLHARASAKAIYSAAAFLIPHTSSGVIYHAVKGKEKCGLWQKQNQIHREENANFEAGLNCTTLHLLADQDCVEGEFSSILGMTGVVYR